MTISGLISKEDKTTKRLAYRKAQLGKLIDGSAWEYTGIHCEADVGENAKCQLCGTKIRNKFLIRCTRDVANEVGVVKEGTELWIGAVCLSNHSEVNPDMVAAIEKDYKAIQKKKREALVEARKAAKEAALDAEIREAGQRWQKTVAIACEYVSLLKLFRKWVPSELYWAVVLFGMPRAIPAYRRKADIRRFLVSQLEKWDSLLESCGLTLDYMAKCVEKKWVL